MEMHQIRYFLAVARTLNFSRAAEECHVAQPSLSRAVQKLEEELGGPLFRRERSLTHLTELGRLMVPLLTQCYDSATAAKTLATSFRKGSCAPLRLALSRTINLGVLVSPLSELVKAFAGLELKFFRGTAGEVAEQLKSGESELAVAGTLGDDWDRFDSWPLFAERLELVVNRTHPLAAQSVVRIEDLAGQRLLDRPYCEYSAQVAAVLSAQGLQRGSGDQIVSDNDLLALLEANVGVGILPRSTFGSANLHTLPIEGLNFKSTVYLYAVSGRQRSPAATTLIKLLRAADWSGIVPSAILDDPPLRRPAASAAKGVDVHPG